MIKEERPKTTFALFKVGRLLGILFILYLENCTYVLIVKNEKGRPTE